MTAIAIWRDYDGLKRATLELLEEAHSEPENERLRLQAEIAANREAILASIVRSRTMADGYYHRVGYLLELELTLQMGSRVGDLEMSDVRGLFAIARARNEFSAKHPPCKGCGRPLPNAETGTCPDCESAAFQASARGRRD